MAAAAGLECEMAVPPVATPTNGWAQARDYRASSMLPDERSFA